MVDAVEPELVHEDDRLTVWKGRLEPGESMARHSHEVGFVVVVLGGDRVRVAYGSGEARDSDVEPGEAYAGGHRDPHVVTNTGSETYEEIVVDLK